MVMKHEKQILARFRKMKDRIKMGDEDDVEALYWGDALAWVLNKKPPQRESDEGCDY